MTVSADAEYLDAVGLAAHFANDVARLQVQRDRVFFGNSTSRAFELPRYDHALAVARQMKRDTVGFA